MIGDSKWLYILAMGYLESRKYPWSLHHILGVIDQSVFNRLQRSGWLRQLNDREYAIWHDRLLGWAMAVALFEHLCNDEISVETAVSRIRTFLLDAESAKIRGGRSIPEDFFYLCLSWPHHNEMTILEVVKELGDSLRANGVINKLEVYATKASYPTIWDAMNGSQGSSASQGDFRN